MRSIRFLPLLAMSPLLGCDGPGDWLRTPGAATAYAAPLASDTSVVTTRRVWSSAADTTVSISLDLGAIMPGGARMAVTDWISGDPAVFDLVSKEVRRFRFNDEPYDTGMAMYTVASTDGRQIVFFWVNWSERDDPYLRVVDVASGESRTLLAPDTTDSGEAYPVAWTPAGDSVFALIYPDERAGDVRISLIPAAGGTPRLVHTIPRRAFSSGPMSLSPDGRWLLYAHELSRAEQSRSDIYIIDVQGGGARPFVEHPAVDQPVGWLPGTNVVLFSSDRSGTTDLWSVRVVNGRASAEPRLVRSGFFRSQPVGFGGGALFYGVTTGSSGAAVVNMDPQSGALLGTASPPLEDLHAFPGRLAWSPDGQTIAAVTGGHIVSAITLHSMETGDSRVFWLDEGVHPIALQWAADGQALFLKAGGEAELFVTSPGHFLRMDLVTGTTTRLFAAADSGEASPLNRSFGVTPDGRSVVLPRQQRTRDDDWDGMMLVLRSLEDGSERELHRTSDVIPDFRVSPDGTQLAFVQQAWEESDSLFVIRADAAEPLSDSLFVMRMDSSEPLRAVAGWDHAVTLLGWLPAGNALLAARLSEDGTAEEILRIELDGSTRVVGISPFPPQRGAALPGANRSRLLLSPAGNRLVHQVSDIGQELWRMDGLHELFAKDAAGRR
ncbi:MAG: hypothetical protein ABR602_14665 [Gemmatimonadales bacterium]